MKLAQLFSLQQLLLITCCLKMAHSTYMEVVQQVASSELQNSPKIPKTRVQRGSSRRHVTTNCPITKPPEQLHRIHIEMLLVHCGYLRLAVKKESHQQLSYFFTTIL